MFKYKHILEERQSAAAFHFHHLFRYWAVKTKTKLLLPPPGSYNAVRISSSGVALGGGLRIYEAYFYKPTTTNITCDQPLDVLYGSTGPIAGSLNGVENAYNSIDGNQSTFARSKQMLVR